MSEYKEGPRPETDQDLLLKKLKDGSLSPKDFLKEVYELDQRTQERVDSKSNLDLLLSPEVRQVFEDNEDQRDDYFNGVSFASFHYARWLGVFNSEARPYFDRACEAARQIESSDFDEWKNYVDAWPAVLNGDRARLQEIASKVTDENLAAVQRMLEYLDKQG